MLNTLPLGRMPKDEQDLGLGVGICNKATDNDPRFGTALVALEHCPQLGVP